MTLITTITTARNNAELIRQCHDLGYLRDEWFTLDPTWGYGKFWTLWKPADLLATDLDPLKSPMGRGASGAGVSVDFTDMPWSTGSFDAVVLDGPYKLNGTSTGEGPSASDASFGVDGEAVRWQDRHALICAGIDECLRVLEPKGYLLVKCQDQVCSGKKRWQTRIFADHAEKDGRARLVDMLHLPGGRDQPEGRRQCHSRQNYSTMLIIQKGPK